MELNVSGSGSERHASRKLHSPLTRRPVEVGTPGQRSVLKVDPGSPTMGFENPRSNACQQSNQPCVEYGSYDNLTSSTAAYVGDSYRDLLSNLASGSLINDTIKFGDLTLPNFHFGTWDTVDAHFFITSPDTGILGTGQICTTSACDLYPTFIQQLFDRGLWALEHTPSTLALTTLARLLTSYRTASTARSRAGRSTPFRWSIQLPTLPVKPRTRSTSTSFTFTTSTGSFTAPAIPGENSAPLDTGNPYFSLNLDTFMNVANYYGIDWQLGSAPINFPVDCSFRSRRTHR